MSAPVTPGPIAEASYQAHMAASRSFGDHTGADPAVLTNVTHTLAHAYGEALALYAASGAERDQTDAMHRIVERAAQGMSAAIASRDCGGSA